MSFIVEKSGGKGSYSHRRALDIPLAKVTLKSISSLFYYISLYPKFVSSDKKKMGYMTDILEGYTLHRKQRRNEEAG